MNEPKIIRKPEAREDYETHEVPFDSLPVRAFVQAPLRQAVADWWRPSQYSTQDPDLDVRKRNVLWELMLGIQTEGQAFVNKMPVPSTRVRIQLNLDYPLHHHWKVNREVPLAQLGQIFGMAYNMYQHIYLLEEEALSIGSVAALQQKDQEDIRWWKDHSYETEPKIDESLPECARGLPGSFVWGHDLSDLVFETVLFCPADDIKPFDPDAPIPEKVPFLGTFAFGIGS